MEFGNFNRMCPAMHLFHQFPQLVVSLTSLSSNERYFLFVIFFSSCTFLCLYIMFLLWGNIHVYHFNCFKVYNLVPLKTFACGVTIMIYTQNIFFIPDMVWLSSHLNLILKYSSHNFCVYGRDLVGDNYSYFSILFLWW